MTKLNVDIQPRGTAYVEAPFDKAKAILEENGYKIISLEENVLLRMQEGKDAKVSRYGNWTREGFIYIPKKGVFLVRNSPVLDDTKKATKEYSNGRDFYPTKSQFEKALEDSVLIPFKSSINIPINTFGSDNRSSIKIPTNRFGNDDIISFAFSKHAKAYGEFLRDIGIKEMPVWLVGKDYVKSQRKPFVRQLWFSDIVNRSEICGCYRGLSYNNGVRGVRKNVESVVKF